MKRICPVCKNTEYKLIFHDKNRREGLDIEGDFVKCSHCGMKYLTNIPAFDDFKDNYTEIYNHEYFKVSEKKLYQTIKKCLILDAVLVVN
jgi:ssDNA-specific exonuclease RecJ